LDNPQFGDRIEIGVLSDPQFREQQLVVIDVVNWEKCMNVTFLKPIPNDRTDRIAQNDFRIH
jgi:hypothetical protein